VLAGLAARHLPPPQEIRGLDQYAECDAVAIAPFVVKATYSWHLGPLMGEAGTVFSLWLAGVALEASYLAPHALRILAPYGKTAIT
jgi:hypothetical protein